MNKRFLVIATVLISLFFVTNAYCVIGNVKDNNNGNAGYILVNSGQKQGQNDDIGTWTDPTTISTLKGDKGDKGDTGIQGIRGFQGNDGQDGINGIDGVSGIDGIKGDIGLQGLQGVQGNKGDIGSQGTKGDKGNKGDRGEQGERGKGLENQVKAGIEFRLFDTQHTTSSIYVNRDFANRVTETGFKLTIKLGTSYEEREIAKTNIRLSVLEKNAGTSTVITKVMDTKGNITHMSITAQSGSIKREF